MPKKIKKFTVHLQNPKTKPETMVKYLERKFGPMYNDWYVGRNYNRPSHESHIEITFYTEPNKKHLLMMLEHPYVIIDQEVEEWYEVSSDTFNSLFEGSE